MTDVEPQELTWRGRLLAALVVLLLVVGAAWLSWALPSGCEISCGPSYWRYVTLPVLVPGIAAVAWAYRGGPRYMVAVVCSVVGSLLALGAAVSLGG